MARSWSNRAVGTPQPNPISGYLRTILPFRAPQVWHFENLASFSNVHVLHAQFSFGAFAFAFAFVIALGLGLGLLAAADDDGDDDVRDASAVADLRFRAMASANDSSGLAGSIKFARPATSRGGLPAFGDGTSNSLATSCAAPSSACAAPRP